MDDDSSLTICYTVMLKFAIPKLSPGGSPSLPSHLTFDPSSKVWVTSLNIGIIWVPHLGYGPPHLGGGPHPTLNHLTRNFDISYAVAPRRQFF